MGLGRTKQPPLRPGFRSGTHPAYDGVRQRQPKQRDRLGCLGQLFNGIGQEPCLRDPQPWGCGVHPSPQVSAQTPVQGTPAPTPLGARACGGSLCCRRKTRHKKLSRRSSPTPQCAPRPAAPCSPADAGGSQGKHRTGRCRQNRGGARLWCAARSAIAGIGAAGRARGVWRTEPSASTKTPGAWTTSGQSCWRRQYGQWSCAAWVLSGRSERSPALASVGRATHCVPLLVQTSTQRVLAVAPLTEASVGAATPHRIAKMAIQRIRAKRGWQQDMGEGASTQRVRQKRRAGTASDCLQSKASYQGCHGGGRVHDTVTTGAPCGGWAAVAAGGWCAAG